MAPRKYDPCKSTACKIQKCLKEKHYQESACWEVLEEMRQCCIKHKNEESVCCEGMILDRPYVPNNSAREKNKTDSKDKLR